MVTGPVSAGFFADKAKEYMSEKSLIMPYLKKRFDDWRKKYQSILAFNAASKKRLQERIAEDKKKDAEGEKWLDQMLNNRK